jgi:hypothetical protein
VGAGSAGVAREGVAEAEAGGPARERYYRQPDACELRDRYLPQLKRAIASAYTIGPVTADDLVMLEAYLRTYVADEDLRQELLDSARLAASRVQGR